MSYRFCLGASGAGKSTWLHREVIRRASLALDRFVSGPDPAQPRGTGRDAGGPDTFLYLVPDQYTMQTQKDLVLAAGERGGIMNVDVLSFGRLAHRVFAEIGAEPRGVLDDMGKSLILRRLSLRCQKDLKVLGSRIGRPGMTAEVKSVISEFMQYGISPEGVGELADYAAGRGQGSLAARLCDIQILYRAFLDERESRFLTGEEQYDLLAEAIPRSGLIERSVVVIDGFTGFTPVQARVVLALMQRAQEVIIALDWADDGGTPIEDVMAGRPWDAQDLFCLTRQTAAQMSRLAREGGVAHADDIYIGENTAGLCGAGCGAGQGTGRSGSRRGDDAVPRRFRSNPALAHLERSLFRYPVKEYPGRDLPVHLILASNPGQEVRQMCIRIRRLIEQHGWAYRSFAVIAGDLSAYEDEIRVYAERYDLPVYIDSRRAVTQNPLTETIRGALEIGAGDYSYETVFRFLRSGLTGLTADEIDRLENECLRRGIASRRRWETAFESAFEPMRQVFLAAVRPLQDQGRANAQARTKALYEFLLGIRAGEQMASLAADFRARGQDAEAMEYEQIYGAVIHLLEELYDLPGGDPISAKDYLELVEVGFQEIRLGTLPQQVDRILVGDLERTRLSEVKCLFVLGVNDGAIPKSASKGGLLSDLDREFLQDSEVLREKGLSLAPTPREQMVIQRLYLYMNLTKPTEELCLSYAAASGDGGSIRPSYLIALLQQMFPTLSVERPEEAPAAEQMTAPKDAAGVLAPALRDYADGRYLQDDARTDELLTLYGYCVGRERTSIPALRRAAFLRYRPVPISQRTANALYGRVIRGSVTRLETAAQCYLRQFLQYGLRLREREVYDFEPKDSGTILHESIRRFGQLLAERGISWTDCTQEEGRELVKQALRETAGQYHDQVLYATARGTYQAGRLQRILERTADTLQFQLRQGDFAPAALEQDFGAGGDLRYDLEDGGVLLLNGRIDRVDLLKEDGRIYVKIVDYKSGSRDLDVRQMRAGLQLQLMVYMTAERRLLQRTGGGDEIVPAAMLYCRFDDPMLPPKDAQTVLREAEEGESPADSIREGLVRRQLRPKGLVNSDPDVLRRLDHVLAAGGGDSLAVPVRTKKDGAPDSRSSVVSGQGFEDLAQDVQDVICRLAEDILAGRTDAAPVRMDGSRTACTWCPYANACGFDLRTPGYGYRNIGE